ncbi:MAG: hypothetical protein A2Y62_08865 [Candidatus Fischerbacteria bacterium RBG_13_37_8]|uniref:DUF4435 domain-containing protein n=1 Tax=Candidatus Fischerbacteria bacterium RBG_13_37_8 TaxID=1817863 RepID=A0A1F5VUQ9_9BACT|nr:MAG: hypothetical protein A2Y62_08865 [Candidatus Fischerbacteria bacterium RBG_13_37_8]
MIKIENENILLVEGKDDKRFFYAAIKFFNFTDIQVESYDGKDNFKNKIEVFTKKTPGWNKVSSLGIIRDANDNPKGAFQSVIDALKALDLPTPEEPMKVAPGIPKVSIMIVPAIDKQGELEDMCLESLINDPSLPCINQYFSCLNNSKIEIPIKEAKAKIQAFLASRKDPSKRLGEAAEAQYFNFDDEAFLHVKYFLRKLYL